MPTRALNAKFCDSAKPRSGERQTDWFDEGSPGLALRVSSTAKGWSWFFTLSGKRCRMSLGTYPATSLAKARTKADEARKELELGRDPRAIAAAPETLRAIGDEWWKREGAALRTGEDRKAVLERAIYPTLGDRIVSDIRRSEVVRLLDGIEDDRGPAAAHKTLEVLRRVLNFHESRSDDYRSPISRGMGRKPTKRDRVLTDDELRAIWRSAETLNGPFGRYVRFLLLTGARRTEAAAMTWSELEGADWTLPAERNKTKLPLLRSLSPAALSLIGTKPDNAGEFVFSFSGGASPLKGYAKLKTDLDAASGVTGWRLHDLRRSVRSLLSRIGVPSDHAERVLGHVIGGVRGVYDRHEYAEEKAAALRKLAIEIDRIIHDRPKAVRLVRKEAAAQA
jgi:integrase